MLGLAIDFYILFSIFYLELDKVSLFDYDGLETNYINEFYLFVIYESRNLSNESRFHCKHVRCTHQNCTWTMGSSDPANPGIILRNQPIVA